MPSGLKTLTAEIEILDFAMPYPAPRQQRIVAMLAPMAPKNDCVDVRDLSALAAEATHGKGGRN
jgi:hypothetical protein